MILEFAIFDFGYSCFDIFSKFEIRRFEIKLLFLPSGIIPHFPKSPPYHLLTLMKVAQFFSTVVETQVCFYQVVGTNRV